MLAGHARDLEVLARLIGDSFYEVIAVETPHVPVDPRAYRDAARVGRRDLHATRQEVEVVVAGEASLHDPHTPRAPLRIGRPFTVAHVELAAVAIPPRVAPPKRGSIHRQLGVQPVGRRYEFFPHAVGVIVRVTHDARDVLLPAIVGKRPAVSEVAVSDHVVASRRDDLIGNKRVFEDFPRRVGLSVVTYFHHSTLSKKRAALAWRAALAVRLYLGISP